MKHAAFSTVIVILWSKVSSPTHRSGTSVPRLQGAGLFLSVKSLPLGRDHHVVAPVLTEVSLLITYQALQCAGFLCNHTTNHFSCLFCSRHAHPSCCAPGCYLLYFMSLLAKDTLPNILTAPHCFHISTERDNLRGAFQFTPYMTALPWPTTPAVTRPSLATICCWLFCFLC